MNTPKIKVTGFIKHPTGRYTFSINGVRHWTDVRGWGLYTSKQQLVIHPITKFRKMERVQVCLASAGEFRLPADADLAAAVATADLAHLAATRSAARAHQHIPALPNEQVEVADTAALEQQVALGDWVAI